MHSKKSFHSVIFFKDDTTMPIPRKLLGEVGRAIYAGEKIPLENRVHVIFCSDRMIKKLNTQFRGKPYATDVLSFNYDEDDFIGEIYISLQRAAVQARRYEVTYNEEIIRLFVHGMIHLQGYDHEKPSDRKRMEAVER
ncbi:MAG TPA: rRNA maturation RNase YbeY, partial [Chitinivibrionales bacterium]